MRAVLRAVQFVIRPILLLTGPVQVRDNHVSANRWDREKRWSYLVREKKTGKKQMRSGTHAEQ